MNNKRFYFLVFMILFGVIQKVRGQVTPVYDPAHIKETGIEATTTGISVGLKLAFENPAWRNISKVEQFFKDASVLISRVLINLKMTKQLIEKEQRIFQLIEATMGRIEHTENLPSKGLYLLTLVEIYGQATTIFEIFDIATQERMGIINDEGRINIIKTALEKARTIERSIRVLIRRANKESLTYTRAQRELETFNQLFKKE